MKIYQVSIAKEICADIEVEAVDEIDAREKAAEVAILTGEWCEGHRPFDILSVKQLILDED